MVDFPQRGEIYWVEFTPARGAEQAGRRPALIVQNDVGNRYAPTTIVAAITSRGGGRQGISHRREAAGGPSSQTLEGVGLAAAHDRQGALGGAHHTAGSGFETFLGAHLSEL